MAGAWYPDIWSVVVGCCCDVIFQMRLTFKPGDFEKSRLPAIIWLHLIQLVEGLKRKKIDQPPHPPGEKGILQQTVFGWSFSISSPPTHPADFRLPSLCHHMNQFLKITLSLSVSHKHAHTYTHIPTRVCVCVCVCVCILFLWRTLTTTRGLTYIQILIKNALWLQARPR